MKIIIIGQDHALQIQIPVTGAGLVISYEKICRLADKPIGATVTYRYGKEAGTLLPSQPIIVPVGETPIFNCAWTGDA